MQKTVKKLIQRLRRGPVLILAAALGMTVFLIATRPDRPAMDLPEKAWNVDVMPAKRAAIRPTLELYGRIESPLDASLSAAVEADVVEVAVQDGESVDAGQLLVVLDGRDAELELVQREADFQEIQAQISLERRRLFRSGEALTKEQELLQLTESNAERARSLYKDKLLSQANVDDTAEELKRQQLAVTSRQLAIEESEIRIVQLQAQLRRAEALRDRAALTVERTRLTAPFSGVISELEVSQGDRVRVGDSLMRLHDPASLELRAQIPSRYAARVRSALAADVEMRASVEVDGEVLPAVLQRIASQTREGSGSVESFLGFEVVPDDARLGDTVRLMLSLPTEPDAIAVPAEAVYGRNRVYKVANDRMVSVEVQRLGERVLRDGSSQLIVRSSQLADDDQIIVTKISTAANGLLVRVVPRDPADASMMAARDRADPAP